MTMKEGAEVRGVAMRLVVKSNALLFDREFVVAEMPGFAGAVHGQIQSLLMLFTTQSDAFSANCERLLCSA